MKFSGKFNELFLTDRPTFPSQTTKRLSKISFSLQKTIFFGNNTRKNYDEKKTSQGFYVQCGFIKSAYGIFRKKKYKMK